MMVWLKSKKWVNAVIAVAILSGVCLLLGWMPNACAEWIMAEGSANIEQGDVAGAKKAALHDAERNAIERVVGVMLSSESKVESFTLIQDKILTRVEGYVRDLSILSESCSRVLCTVKIKADVEKMDLADDLAAIARVLPKMNYPTVGVALTSEGMDSRAKSVDVDLLTAQRAIESQLKKKGFLVVDVSALREATHSEANIFKSQGKKAEGAIEEAIGQVQVLIKGDASFEDAGSSPYNQRIHSYSAAINAKVVETATGEVVGAYSSEASVPSHSLVSGGNKALEKAANRLANKLTRDLAHVWLDACYNPHNIMLVVDGLPFSKSREVVTTIPRLVSGVSNAVQRRFLRNRAEILLEWPNCNVMSLAEKLGGLKAKGWYLEVLSVNGNSVRAEFRLRESP